MAGSEKSVSMDRILIDRMAFIVISEIKWKCYYIDL